MDWSWLEIKNLLDPSHWLGMIVLAVVLWFAAWVVSRLLGKLLGRSNWVMGHLGRRVDPTIIAYTRRLKTVIVYLGALLLYASLVPQLRGLLSTLVAGAGITALVVGFAAKGTLANLMAGFSLAIYRPIRIGDKVTLQDEYGTIEDITLRHTIVRTWENKRLIIPNEKIDSMSLVNHTIIDPKVLFRLELGVSYDTSIDLARRLILEEADKCPHRMPDDKAPEEPWVRVISHGDFSIGLRLYMWCPNVDEFWSARWWILEMVKKRFDAEGVEIPFPYRTLVYKKDLPPPRPGDGGEGGEKAG
ncbi:mechanosensitive ion channel family protein [Desulfoferula mesophila]|uniref:Mechanosensitive ion channel protein MscS n=1 Tax=Desulfoferula mesophila TaxID=3058419 RepID=A0AAU9ECR1_9BACT|nr:mechanosensitive ion channel protein MscS [Desulfoferula mesophilus]